MTAGTLLPFTGIHKTAVHGIGKYLTDAIDSKDKSVFRLPGIVNILRYENHTRTGKSPVTVTACPKYYIDTVSGTVKAYICVYTPNLFTQADILNQGYMPKDDIEYVDVLTADWMINHGCIADGDKCITTCVHKKDAYNSIAVTDCCDNRALMYADRYICACDCGNTLIHKLYRMEMFYRQHNDRYMEQLTHERLYRCFKYVNEVITWEADDS